MTSSMVCLLVPDEWVEGIRNCWSGFIHAVFFQRMVQKSKNGECQSCGHIDVCQRRMGRLVKDDRKRRVTQKNHSLQPEWIISQHCFSSQLRTGKWAYNLQVHQNWTNGRSKKSYLDLQLQDSDGIVRIWCKQGESMDLSWLVSI